MGNIYSKKRNRKKDNISNHIYWTSNEECCVCLERKTNILLLPCKHLVMCDYCSRESINTGFQVCPVCQQDIYSYNLLEIIPAMPNN